MASQAETHTAAKQISEALLENGLLDLGPIFEGASAEAIVRAALERIVPVVAEFVEAEAGHLTDVDDAGSQN
jgi:hypothetical protein